MVIVTTLGDIISLIIVGLFILVVIGIWIWSKIEDLKWEIKRKKREVKEE